MNTISYSFLFLILLISAPSLAQDLFVTPEGDTLPGKIILQEDPHQMAVDLHWTGYHMESAAKRWYVGIALQVGGGAIAAAGAALLGEKRAEAFAPAMLYGGAAIAVGGMGVGLSAFIPIGKAGKNLKNRYPEQ